MLCIPVKSLIATMCLPRALIMCGERGGGVGCGRGGERRPIKLLSRPRKQ